MQEWTVDSPQVIDVSDEVTSLAVRLVAGRVDVVTTDEPTARVEVTDVHDDPLQITVDDEGRLTIRHERLSWDGILGWLKMDRRRAVVSVAVPATCETSIGVVSADAVVAGIQGRVKVRCVSGDVVLDGVGGSVSVESVSGDVEARGLAGRLALKSVSGGLTLAGGAPEKVRADSVSGDVALDLQPTTGVDVEVKTVSGDVTVRVPDRLGLDVDLASTTGDLACSYDGLSRETKPGSRRLRGTVPADGGQPVSRVHGRTVSGTVALLSRQPV